MSSSSSTTQQKFPLKNSPEYVDLLTEDPKISTQQFVCVSFVSPETILKQREMYFFQQFVKQWDFTKSMQQYTGFNHFISAKYNLNVEGLLKDYGEFLAEEGAKIKEESSIEDDYKNFLDKKETDLMAQFNNEHEFQTSVRGLKIRGSFGTEEEARRHAKKTRDRDTTHDVFVCPVGVWVPWHPDAYKTGEVEFLEPQLNELHHEKMKNEAKAKEEFEFRKQQSLDRAMADNLEKARKTGNKLTQSMDENGNLSNIRDKMDLDSREVASADVRDELFEQMKANASKRV